MRAHTDAYQVYKEQVEDILNFAVLVCYAVPSLKRQMKSADEGSSELPRPDFFIHDKNTTTTLRSLANGYRDWLGPYISISGFSYFESYLKSVVFEMVEFHGGSEEFLSRSVRRNTKDFSPTKSILENKRKLQDARTPGKIQKYQKHSRILASQEFRFPGDLLSSYGIKRLVEELDDMRSRDLPDLLSDCLLFELTDRERQRFHEIRDMRNQIAHGSKRKVEFRKAFGANNDLHRLAARIDRHMLEHFFVFEDYV